VFNNSFKNRQYYTHYGDTVAETQNCTGQRERSELKVLEKNYFNQIILNTVNRQWRLLISIDWLPKHFQIFLDHHLVQCQSVVKKIIAYNQLVIGRERSN